MARLRPLRKPMNTSRMYMGECETSVFLRRVKFISARVMEVIMIRSLKWGESNCYFSRRRNDATIAIALTVVINFTQRFFLLNPVEPFNKSRAPLDDCRCVATPPRETQSLLPFFNLVVVMIVPVTKPVAGAASL